MVVQKRHNNLKKGFMTKKTCEVKPTKL